MAPSKKNKDSTQPKPATKAVAQPESTKRESAKAVGPKAPPPEKRTAVADPKPSPAKPVVRAEPPKAAEPKPVVRAEPPKAAEPKPAVAPQPPKAAEPKPAVAPQPPKAAEPKPAVRAEPPKAAEPKVQPAASPVSILAGLSKTPPRPAAPTLAGKPAARLSFLADWRIAQDGEVTPGSILAIEYTPERAPTCGGKAGWGVQAAVLFTPGGQCFDGPAVEAGQPVPFSVKVPADATEIQIWFRNWASDTTQQIWDSDFGHNYRFQVKR